MRNGVGSLFVMVVIRLPCQRAVRRQYSTFYVIHLTQERYIL